MMPVSGLKDPPSSEIPIAILGGGIGGLALALALHRHGLACTVYEQAPALVEVGAGLLLTPNACAVLDHLGLLDALAAHALRTPAWFILDRDGRTLQELRPFPRGGTALSTRRSDLQQAMLAALPADCIRLGHAVDTVRVQPTGTQVRFTNGSELGAPLVIAADGAASCVRRQLWPRRQLSDRGYVGWRAVVDGVPEGWADGRITESWGRGQRFGIAAVGGGRTYWYASANTPLTAADDPSDVRGALLSHFRDWHAPVEQLLEATPSAAILRHAIADARPAWSRTAGACLALLGDAAQPLTPNLGQGAAMALEDAWDLADCLAGHGASAAGLRAYQRRRRWRSALVWAASRLVGGVIQSASPRRVRLRDGLLRATPDPLASATLRTLYTFRRN